MGCDRPFCREHGIPHFYSNMINQEGIGAYLDDQSLDDSTKEMIKQANIDRVNIPPT